MNTKIISIKDINIDVIIELLKNDSFVMAVPTDTVYGLVCNANDENAVKKIYSIKKREKNKPLSLFLKNTNELKKYVDCELTSNIKKILDTYWPGKLTVIFKKKKKLYDYITSGKDTIAIRIPHKKLLQEILNKIDFPLAQTSCNLSHEKEYSSAKEIYEKIGDEIDLIVDNIENITNVPSTIIFVDNDKINLIREGDIKLSEYLD